MRRIQKKWKKKTYKWKVLSWSLSKEKTCKWKCITISFQNLVPIAHTTWPIIRVHEARITFFPWVICFYVLFLNRYFIHQSLLMLKKKRVLKILIGGRENKINSSGPETSCKQFRVLRCIRMFHFNYAKWNQKIPGKRWIGNRKINCVLQEEGKVKTILKNLRISRWRWAPLGFYFSAIANVMISIISRYGI